MFERRVGEPTRKHLLHCGIHAFEWRKKAASDWVRTKPKTTMKRTVVVLLLVGLLVVAADNCSYFCGLCDQPNTCGGGGCQNPAWICAPQENPGPCGCQPGPIPPTTPNPTTSSAELDLLMAKYNCSEGRFLNLLKDGTIVCRQ